VDKKRKIGIIYNTSDNWIGGKYYLDSIIAVLKSNNALFDLHILSSRCKKDIGKKYFFQYKLNIFERVLQKFRSKLPTLSAIYLKIFRNGMIKKLKTFDFFFPAMDDFIFDEIPDSKKMYWIPDFQENHHPEFFEKQDIINRITLQVNAAYSNSKLILSSKSSNKDFMRLYPYSHCSIIIIPFISYLYFKKYDIPKYDIVQKKYFIDGNYFICSNQFWKHKNHGIVIDAVSILKKKSQDIRVLFTGKEYDYRCSEYILELKKKVRLFNLEKNISFLGFVSRGDQIALIKYARAIIQPSLFEGWNTTIEDAKFLGKEIIASAIDVHKEQLGEGGYYFDPANAEELANIIQSFIKTSPTLHSYSYLDRCLEYQKEIVHSFS
jgi:glycosyltransferase involved in cell wall biosynthesis